MLVDRAGDQFLAGSTLAIDQHDDILVRHSTNRLVDISHGRAASDDGVAASVLDRGTRCLGDDCGSAHQARHFQRLGDDLFEAIKIQGFEQVFEGSVPHRLNRGFCAGCCGHEDNRDARIDLADALVHFQASHVGQVYIQQNHVGLGSRHVGDRIAAISDNVDLETVRREDMADLLED